MSLSNDLISQFVKVTKDNDKSKKESTVYGTIVKDGDLTYVRLDGADENTLTPISSTSSVEDGDRVIVMIKNHMATITGNLHSPSVGTAYVDDKYTDTITDVEILIADKVSSKELDSEIGRIEKVISDQVKADKGKFESLEASDATITEQLNVNKASIENLETTKLDSAIADITYATIDELDATNVEVHELEATHAEFATTTTDKLEAVDASIKSLDVNKLSVESADIRYAKITELDSTNADVKKLESEVADIDTLIFGSASGSTIQASFANAVIAQLGNAQIKSAMIESVAADKITAGDIITNNVRVMSEDGTLIISDETIQISDQHNIVRVQIGKDAYGDYSIYIWDVEGNLMFSKGGITDSAIKSAIIRNDMVSDTANISAHKLNIDSLFEVINDETNTKTIKSSKVYLDDQGQKLDVAFQIIDERLSSIGTELSVAQGKIESKVWEQDITDAVDDIQIGGRNLLTNSDTIHVSYYYGAASGLTHSRTDEGYLQIIAESGNGNWLSLDFDGEWKTLLENEFSEGDKFVISFTMRSPDTTVPPTVYLKSGLGYYKMSGALSSEWSTVWYAGAWKENGNITPYLGFSGLVGTYVIKNCKIERGTKATDWTPAPEDTQSDIENAQSVADEAQALAYQNASDMATIVTNFNADITNLQTQIDGSITSWFYEIAPTTSNEPAVNWTTTDLKNIHLGDLYYDTITGYCYRWQVQNNAYSWQRITDSDVTKALSDAQAAQDTADQKRRVFYVQPVPPYDIGDLWVQGDAGDILRCSTAKTSGQSYVRSDWVLASKYTDDTVANEAKNTANINKDSISTLNTRHSSLEQKVDSINLIVENHATQIADKADSSTVTEVNNKVSNLEVSLDGFKTSVGETYATKTDVDDIQIGGRNLIRNSKFNFGTQYWVGTGVNYSVHYDSNKEGKCLQFNSGSPGDANHRIYPDTVNNFTHKSGVKYTLSFFVRASADTTIQTNISGSLQPVNHAVTTSWTKIVRSYVATGTGSLTFWPNEANVTIHMAMIKLEEGDKATDWTPDHRDIESRMSTAETSITQNEESIELLSTRTETVENKFDEYSTTEEVESLISVSADGIYSSVSLLVDTTNQKVDIVNSKISGRNLIIRSESTLNAYYDQNGTFIANITNGTAAMTSYIPITPNTKYTFSRSAGGGDYFRFNWYDADKNYISRKAITDIADGTAGTYTWTSPDTAYYLLVSYPWDMKSKAMLEIGDSATQWSLAPEDMATGEELTETNSRVTTAETAIEQLSDSISMLVTDGNGTSLMTQTETGWTFSTAEIQNAVNRTSESLGNLVNEVGDVNSAVSILQSAVADLGTIAEYVKITTYEDEPCIELGEGDSDFKLRITNTRMIFAEGSTTLAYFNNQSFHVKKAVIEEELSQGGFIWKVRSNGNLGLVWKGATV